MRPDSEEALSALIADASAPFEIIGGGTRSGFGGPVSATTLSTGGLSGVRLYEPGALTLVAGAGTPLANIEDLLAKNGQHLPFEPMDLRALLGTSGTPTLGGVVATNASGPRRIQVGACRDFLLGVRFVDGAGRLIKSGGRVMKNVTGYDLVKLMAGSFGTLGVLTEVSLKVLPKPETTSVLLFEGLDDAAAVKALSLALGSPFDVSGAAHVPIGLDGDPVTMIRIEGFAASVEYRANRLREALSQFGTPTVETAPERTEAGWKWVRDVEIFAKRDGDVWRFSVKPSDGPALGQTLRDLFGADVMYDWGGGLVWALVPPKSDARAALETLPGHATRVRGSGDATAFQSQTETVQRLMDGVRAKYDPRGLLNPGRMV